LSRAAVFTGGGRGFLTDYRLVFIRHQTGFLILTKRFHHPPPSLRTEGMNTS
jgi:hypothetical protein